jgi:hypothetical protein
MGTGRMHIGYWWENQKDTNIFINQYTVYQKRMPEGKRPLGRPRRRWVDNNKMDLRERRWDGIDWIDLAQDRDQWRALVNTVMNLRVP